MSNLSHDPTQTAVAKVIEWSVKNPLLIAAGSGITPVLSIARSLLEGDPDAEVTLVYGNRTTGDIMFRETLEELKDRFMDRFSLVFVLSREDQDVDIANGRIDADKLKLLAGKGIIDPASHDLIAALSGGARLGDAVATVSARHAGFDLPAQLQGLISLNIITGLHP